MKKKFGLILIALMFILCMLCLVACHKTNNVSINYGYYFFSTSNDPADMNKINSTVWVKATNDMKWEASDNTSGFIEIKNNSVIFRKNTYATYMICSYENGVMSIYGTEGVYLVQNDTAERINRNEYTTFDTISTPEEFLAIADSVTNSSVSYVLTSDIDFTNFTTETVIDEEGREVLEYKRTIIEPLFGGKEYAFSGIIDGNGHTIRGLTVNVVMPESGDNYPKGLISKSDGGIIKNLKLEDIDIITSAGGYLPTGLLIGEATNTTISNVQVKGSITYQAIGMAMNKEFVFGGLVGKAIDSHISYCSIETAKTGGSKNSYTFTLNDSEFTSMTYGGVVGLSSGNTIINQCYFRGATSVSHKLLDLDNNATHKFDSKVAFGGILGRHDSTGDITVTNCYIDSVSTNLSCQSANASNSYKQDIYAGGVVGLIEPLEDTLVDIKILNCAISGSISGQSSMSIGSLSLRAGGVVGYVDGTITNSFSSGDVSFEARTASPGTSDTISLLVAGICPNADLTGCFQIGKVNANLYIEQDSNVTYDHVYYSAVRLTLSDEMRSCLYDGDTETSKVTGNIYNKSNASLPENTYLETRNKTRDNSTLTGYPESSVTSSTTLKSLRTVYSIGFKQYKNIMDITANPENAWAMAEGSLPKLHWIQ